MTRLRLPVGSFSPQGLQSAFDLLERWANGLSGGMDIRAGFATLGWPGGSVYSNALTVSHSLGVVPLAVVAVASGSTGLNIQAVLQTTTFTKTDFALSAATVDGQLPLNTATQNCSWIAIG